MKTAYIQSVGGASGDMLLAALLDAGLPIDAIRDAIAALCIPGVKITDSGRNPLRSPRHPRSGRRIRRAPLLTPTDARHRSRGHQTVRTTRSRATAVLQTLFAAEARVHGANPDDIHLHELGTADTLVDVVGVVHGLEQLGIQRIYASPLVLGEATGPRRPGGYSNPAPATLEIIAAARAPVAPERPFHANVGELTTPTGAALITTLADEFRQPAMTLHRIGVGAGGKNPPAFPNVLRLWLGETIPSAHTAPTANSTPTPQSLSATHASDEDSQPDTEQPEATTHHHPDHSSHPRHSGHPRHSDHPRHSGESRNPQPSQSAHDEPVEPPTPPTPPPTHSEPESSFLSFRSEAVEPPASANQQPPTLETVRAAALEAYRNQTANDPSPTPDPNAPFARWQDNVILLETNIDNATGEQLGFAMDQLFAAGALDVWHTPIQMKKNRPAILLSALGPAELETQLAEAILRHTPTLGVRVRPIGRYVADRDTITVQTEYGPIRIKRKYLSGQITTISPEHDDLAAATARAWGVDRGEIIRVVNHTR